MAKGKQEQEQAQRKRRKLMFAAVVVVVMVAAVVVVVVVLRNKQGESQGDNTTTPGDPAIRSAENMCEISELCEYPAGDIVDRVGWKYEYDVSTVTGYGDAILASLLEIEGAREPLVEEGTLNPIPTDPPSSAEVILPVSNDKIDLVNRVFRVLEGEGNETLGLTVVYIPLDDIPTLNQPGKAWFFVYPIQTASGTILSSADFETTPRAPTDQGEGTMEIYTSRFYPKYVFADGVCPTCGTN